MGDGMFYTVMVAIVGMLIVFVFLLLLSGLMILTKRAMKDRSQESATATDVSSLRSKASQGPVRVSAKRAREGAPPWLSAAVVAFVLAEQEAHSAESWIRGRRS